MNNEIIKINDTYDALTSDTAGDLYISSCSQMKTMNQLINIVTSQEAGEFGRFGI